MEIIGYRSVSLWIFFVLLSFYSSSILLLIIVQLLIKFYENFQALNSAIHLDYWHYGFNLVFLNCIKNLVVQLIDMFRFPSDLGFKSLLPISTIKNLVFLNCISRPVLINSSIMTTIKMTMMILKKDLKKKKKKKVNNEWYFI